MKARALVSSIVVLFALVVPALSGSTKVDDLRIQKAQELFSKYDSLEKAFNSAVADLYSDIAVIRNKRTYPTGQVRELSLPAPKYKELIRTAMPAAKLRGDTNEYSDIQYTIEGDGVRITVSRFSNLKQYSSPLQLLVRPSASGSWLIYEELSESQP
jgi:hypothetical protein